MMNRYTQVFIVIIILSAITAGYVGWTLNPNQITPNDEFFTISLTEPPNIDADNWELRVNGLVETQANYSYQDILNMPNTTVTATLKCVEGPYGRAEWKGVRISHILMELGVGPGAKEIIFYGADGFTSSLTLEDAAAEDMLLAYQMNGESLPREQGYPLRVVAPGKAGYKWVMWVYRIEVVDYDHKGYWESRGWDDDADLGTFSDWGVHAILLSVAAVFGGLAAISGMKFSRYSNFWHGLGPTFDRKFHLQMSYAYNGILYPTFTYWIFATYRYRGDVFYTNHGMLALSVIILHVIGAVTGIPLIKGKQKGRLVHLTTNMLGYLLLLGTIATGLILVVGRA